MGLSRSLSLLGIVLALLQVVCGRPPIGSRFGVPEDATFDYVIIGGGTAGLTVANRLALDGRYSVAVVEAGSWYQLDNGNRSEVPAWSVLRPPSSLVDWGFMTQPQEGFNDRTLPYVRGKCLGGSSARNQFVYQRPSKGAMDQWATEVGDDSWSWRKVYPLYRDGTQLSVPPTRIKSSNSTPTFNSSHYGDGLLHLSYSAYVAPIASYFLNAFRNAGSKLQQQGFANGDLLGSGFLPSTIDAASQERSTSASVLINAREDSQLVVYTHSLAKRLLFSSDLVQGAEIDTAGKKWTISARRELVLSAGAIQSPQLLMVSGIGPRDVLLQNHIAVKIELPGVGQNMMDNPGFSVSFPVTIETSSTYANDPERLNEAVQEYNTHRSGFLTSTAVDVLSFEDARHNPHYNLSTEANDALSWTSKDWPTVEHWQFAGWVGPYLGSPPPSKENYASILSVLIAPLSRGYVSIASSDMADKPVIDPKWLTHPVDQEVAVAAFKRARKIIYQGDLDAIMNGPEAYPGADVVSDADILSNIREQGMTISHVSGTCKMGRLDDEMAVVGSDFRVRGVQNLRVVDLSAVPFLPPGQPQATVYMMAEKAAKEILTAAAIASKRCDADIVHTEL